MKIKKTLFLCASLLLLILPGCSLKYRIKKADKAYGQGEYFKASGMYKRVYSQIPSNMKELKARVAFNQGECYRLLNNYRAEISYQNAIRLKYADSVVYLRYAQVLQQLSKYPEAAQNYSIYLKKDSSNRLASNNLMACKTMSEWKKNRTRYSVRKADELNLKNSSNFSPSFGSDEDIVFFTSSSQYNVKNKIKTNTITGLPSFNIWMSRKDSKGRWEKPLILSSEVNTLENDEGASTISTDGKTMLFTKARQVAEATVGTEIFISERAGAAWTEAKKLKIFSDTTISVAHPALAPDGETLYFVTDNKNGSIGGKDIWRAKISGGSCKYVENLGSQINTPGDEMFPTVRYDGTLYFASNGWPGYGGLDLYKAVEGKDGKWTISNLGEPVNSNSDDFAISFAGKAERGLFSSNRGDNKGLDNIWSFELPDLAYTVEGKVTDEKGNPIADATIKIVSNTGINARVQTKKDGTYKMKLDKNVECVMLATSRGYLNQQNKVSTKGLTDSKAFNIDFKLSSISKPVQIDNIFYESGKWDLTPASTAGLQILVKLLKDNPNITIEISANTDYIGNNDENKTLSEKRAKSVVDYLIKAGIAADRLSSVGNGEDKPVVVDAALAKKHSFLKINDILNEATTTKLSTEQQEIVNQINRRTEFRVLKTTYKMY